MFLVTYMYKYNVHMHLSSIVVKFTTQRAMFEKSWKYMYIVALSMYLKCNTIYSKTLTDMINVSSWVLYIEVQFVNTYLQFLVDVQRN